MCGVVVVKGGRRIVFVVVVCGVGGAFRGCQSFLSSFLLFLSRGRCRHLKGWLGVRLVVLLLVSLVLSVLSWLVVLR